MKNFLTMMVFVIAALSGASSQPKVSPTLPMQSFWRLSNGTLVPAVSAWKVAGQGSGGLISFDSAGLASFALSIKRLLGRVGPRGFVIDSLFTVGRATGAGDTVKFEIRYGTDISQAGTAIITAPDTIAGVTPNTTTGHRRGTFNNGTIPAGNWMFFTLTKRTGAWKELVIVIEGHTP